MWRVLMGSMLSTPFWGATFAVVVFFGPLSSVHGPLPFNYKLSVYFDARWVIFERGTTLEQPQVAWRALDWQLEMWRRHDACTHLTFGLRYVIGAND